MEKRTAINISVGMIIFGVVMVALAEFVVYMSGLSVS
jgi:hypothetical protein